MHIKESSVLYDVYVKNDTYYQKYLKSFDGVYDENDKSFNDYVNAVQASIPELASLSTGDVSVTVLPESSTDKTSSSTADVSDDVIGIVSTKYSFEGDETQSMGIFTYKNVIDTYQTNKQEASSLLSKLETIYEDDAKLSATVNRYSDASNYVSDFMSKGVDENGDAVSTLSAYDNPLGFAIATLAGEVTGETMDDAMEAQSFFVAGTMEEKIKAWAEEKKRENENALLQTNDTSDANTKVLEEMS